MTRDRVRRPAVACGLTALTVLTTVALTPAAPAAAAPRPTPWSSTALPGPTDRDVRAVQVEQVAVRAGSAVAVGSEQTLPGSWPVYDPWVARLVDGTWTRDRVPPVENGSRDESLHRVAVVAADDVWAVGSSGSGAAVWRWNGRAWTATPVRKVTGCAANASVRFDALTATPAGVFYAGGSCTTVAGAPVAVVVQLVRPGSWQVVARVASRSGVVDLAADAAGTVWATRFRARSTSITEQVRGLAITPAGVTLVGETGTTVAPRAPFAVSWTGDLWRPATVSTPNGDAGWLVAADGTADGPVVAVGRYFVGGQVVGLAARPAA